MNIRPFKSSDTQEIINLFRETVHAINSKHYSPEQVAVWAPENINAAKWQESLSKNITYVAESDNKIVGFIDMSHEGYLDRLFVHKDYQGRKIASSLFKIIEQHALKLGLSKIIAHFSITAKPFAERMEFVVVKEQMVIKNGVSLINYVMGKNYTVTVF